MAPCPELRMRQDAASGLGLAGFKEGSSPFLRSKSSWLLETCLRQRSAEIFWLDFSSDAAQGFSVWAMVPRGQGPCGHQRVFHSHPGGIRGASTQRKGSSCGWMVPGVENCRGGLACLCMHLPPLWRTCSAQQHQPGEVSAADPISSGPTWFLSHIGVSNVFPHSALA